MKVELEELGPCKRAVVVEVPPEEVSREWNESYLRLRQKVKVDGFRPGKAPLAVFEARYLSELKYETLNHLVHDFYHKALDELGLKAVNLPKVDEVDVLKNQPLKFKATFEVKPAIEIKDYQGLELKTKKVQVTDKELEEVLKHMQERHSQFVSKEEDAAPESAAIIGAAREGDLVIIDYLATVNNKLLKEGGKMQNYPLILGSKRLLEQIEDGLVGMHKGETKEVSIEFPAYHFNKEMAGKKINFKVTVKDIKEKKLPELDEEFAQEVGGVTLEELKNKVRATIEEEKKKEAEHALKNSALEKIIENNPFELPESLVEYQLERYLEETAKNMQKKGMDLNLSEQGAEAMKVKLKEAAEKRVRSYLALEAIARQEKIEATTQDFNDEIKLIAKESEEALATLQSYLKDEEKRGGIEERILERKAMDIILAAAKIEEVEAEEIKEEVNRGKGKV